MCLDDKCETLITINPRYGNIDYNNPTLLQEYGHFLQTRQWGGLAFIPGHCEAQVVLLI